MSKSTRFADRFDFLLLCSIFFLIYRCPYSKVEESFNTQAVYDLQNYSWWSKDGLLSFDHIEFPGVVPRTFLGPLFLSVIGFPLTMLSRVYFEAPSFFDQVIVRCVLGVWLWWCFLQYKGSVTYRFSNKNQYGIWYADVGCLVSLLTALQFHLPFYMSRTLPNTFALSICLLGYSKWLRGSPIACLCLIGACAVIFRCDLLVLVAPLYLQMLLFREISFFYSFLIGVVAFIFACLLTVSVDTFFWKPYFDSAALASPLFEIMRGWIWPEGMVLHFNTVANRSSEWGTQSWHWYFSNALPRALNSSLLLLLIGLGGLKQPGEEDTVFDVLKSSCIYLTVFDKRGEVYKKQKELIYYIAPAFMFVGLYSYLPHKELRFIFPSIPLFTLGAAVGLQRMLTHSNFHEEDYGNTKSLAQSKSKGHRSIEKRNTKKQMRTPASSVYGVLGAVCRGSSFLIILLALSAYNVFLLAAEHNYPGGVALQWLTSNLHLFEGEFESSSSGSSMTSHVHIDVQACMTGVSRFGQQSIVGERRLIYSKNEELALTKQAYNAFDWLITSKIPGDHDVDYLSDFEVMHTVNGFEGLNLVTALGSSIGYQTKSPQNCLNDEWNWLPPYSIPVCVRLVPSLHILRKRGASEPGKRSVTLPSKVNEL